MCLYPKLIKNRKYVANKKNGGVIPAFTDKRVLLVPVGCGKCMECMKMKAREWSVRLHEELRENKKAKMVTLTFSTENLKELSENISLEGYEKDNEIAIIAVRRFLERHRKLNKKSIRHWLVTELGGGRYEHLHIHGILWTEKSNEEIIKLWKYGHVHFGDYVNEKTVNYIVKYIYKTDEKHREYKPKILCSKGIGKNYLNRSDYKKNRYKGKNTDESYTNKQGIKMSLPIYYRNKIYKDEEKEKLWLQKLDKEKRYINGIEIDISNGDERYYKVLEEQRKLNKKLGYGDNEINWSRKWYENQRRNELYKKRFKEK